MLLISALRPHHWMKNALILTPILFFPNAPVPWLSLLGGFIAFSLAASFAYLLNDCVDREHDLLHPYKNLRPVALGHVSVRTALNCAVSLLVSALTLSWFLSFWFFITLLAYVLLNLLYSLWLKRLYLIDVFAVSLFYYARIFAGYVLLQKSSTLFQTGFFLFFVLSLGFMKRTAELVSQEGKAQTLPGRNYAFDDILILLISGLCTGLVGVFIFVIALFEARVFVQPALAWLSGGLLVYWLLRLWRVVWRSPLKKDLVWQVLRDPVSLILVIFHSTFYFSGIHW